MFNHTVTPGDVSPKFALHHTLIVCISIMSLLVAVVSLVVLTSAICS